MGNQRFSITPSGAVGDQQLSDSVYRTLAALGVYGDQHGWCWPSLTTLGNRLGKSKQAVSRDIKTLRELGYVQVRPRYDEETGARRSNMMRILFDTEDTPSTLEVNGASTPEVDGASTPEVDDNVPLERPSKRTKGADAPAAHDVYQKHLALLAKSSNSTAIVVDLAGELFGEEARNFGRAGGEVKRVQKVMKSTYRKACEQVMENLFKAAEVVPPPDDVWDYVAGIGRNAFIPVVRTRENVVT